MLNKILLPSFIFLLLLKIGALNFTTFNLFGDEAQYWLWSKDIDFGYFSKPPFLSWIIRVYTEILGSSFVSLKLLPSFVYLLISWSIYNLLINAGLNKKDSFAGCLIFLFIPAVSFSSFIISTDLFLLLFWTLSLNELVKINGGSFYTSGDVLIEIIPSGSAATATASIFEWIKNRYEILGSDKDTEHGFSFLNSRGFNN